MAQQRGQDLFSKLADRGEDVIGRIGDLPGSQKLLESANQLKARVDDMQKKMRGLDELERRVTALEKKVGVSTTASKPRSTGAKKSTTAKKTTTPKPKS
jgi:hypothetical protein